MKHDYDFYHFTLSITQFQWQPKVGKKMLKLSILFLLVENMGVKH